MTSHRTPARRATAIYTVVTADGRCYGGKTVDPTQRLRDHRKKWPGCTLTVHRWVPVGGDWVQAEREHITALRASGAVMLNQNPGGGGPATLTPAQRKAVSDAMTGRVFSDAHRQALSQAMTNASPEHRSKIGDANRRRVWTPEARAKIAAANTARRMKVGV